MKKLLTVFMAILLTAALITGCGSTSTPSAPTGSSPGASSTSTQSQKPSDSAEKIELTVWESTGGPDEFIQKAGEEFVRSAREIGRAHV